MTNDQLRLMARSGALRAYVSRAFEGSTGGWAGRRDQILRLIDELEGDIKKLPQRRSTAK